MNLSALNTGLKQAAANTAPEASPSGTASLRLPAGTLSGEDFAAFLRHQVRALKNNQRQEIAAAPLPKALPPADRHAAAADRQQDKAADRQQDKAAADRSNVQSEDANQRHAKARSDASARQEAQSHQRAATEEANAESAAVLAATGPDAEQAVITEELTTIPLSPSINIITVANTPPDEKSLSDFALAMGLDPEQVQALFGASDQAHAQSAPAVSTQQMLAMSSLPTVSAPAKPLELSAHATPLPPLPPQTLTPIAVSTADFQAMKVEMPLDAQAQVANAIKTVDILNMQVSTGTSPANVMAVTAAPVSTLAVLSMMDTQLRAEDIETLKTEFDALNALDTGADSHGLGSGSSGSSASANAASKATAAFVNNPDMAQTFDKLSEKLATELAGRMHEKLNAGEWKMKFALKPASLGLVDVQLEMRDGKLTAQFNADTSLTQELIQNGSQRLKEALGQLGMNNASVLVGQGHQQGQASGQSGNSRQGGDNHAKLESDSVTEALGSVRPRHGNSLQFDTYA
jgi:flagellar hook-length control protein FliK